MKKRLLYVLLATCFIISALNIGASARLLGRPYIYANENAGTILGQYYSTDIRAFLNYKPIESYNIGGRTLICIEDFSDYGFTAFWDPTIRLVEADPIKPYPSDEGEKDFGNLEKTAQGGDYYKTDIIAFVNGKNIDAYNIGGRTLICIEDLKYCGFDVYWDGENRTIAANIQAIPDRDFSQAERMMRAYDEEGRTLVSVKPPYLSNMDTDEFSPARPGIDENEIYESKPKMGVFFVFRVPAELDYDTVMTVSSKKYFPIFNEYDEDVSDDFNYFIWFDPETDVYSTYTIFILFIELKPEIFNNIQEENIDNPWLARQYSEYVKIYMPGNIFKGMSPSFDYYLQGRIILRYDLESMYGYPSYD